MGHIVGEAGQVPVGQLDLGVPGGQRGRRGAWFCAVMSRAMEAAPIVVPYSSLTGDTDTDTGNVVPSLRCRTVS